VDKIQKAIIHLLQGNGVFYASLIMQMNRNDGKDLPEGALMGVSIQNGRIHLHADPSRLENLSVEQVATIMEHECLHLVLEHISRRGNNHPYVWNVATDLAVNSLLKDIDLGLVPGKEPFTDVPRGKSAEFYMALLQEKMKVNQVSINGDGSITVKDGKTGKSKTYKMAGDHSGWKDSEGKSLDEEVIKQAVQEAAQQARQAGKFPGNIEDLINKLLAQEKINWKQLLRQYVGAAVKSDSYRTWKRENKRFGEDQKGRARNRIIDIAVAIDTSGSVSNDELNDFMNEIHGIQNTYKGNIEIIECDAAVQRTYKLTKFAKVKPDMRGRGGTDFRPVFQLFEERRRKPGLLIFFTDLEGPFPDKESVRTLWVRTGQGYADKVPFGRMIALPKPEGRNRY